MYCVQIKIDLELFNAFVFKIIKKIKSGVMNQNYNTDFYICPCIYFLLEYFIYLYDFKLLSHIFPFQFERHLYHLF